MFWPPGGTPIAESVLWTCRRTGVGLGALASVQGWPNTHPVRHAQVCFGGPVFMIGRQTAVQQGQGSLPFIQAPGLLQLHNAVFKRSSENVLTARNERPAPASYWSVDTWNRVCFAVLHFTTRLRRKSYTLHRPTGQISCQQNRWLLSRFKRVRIYSAHVLHCVSLVGWRK